MTLGLHIAAHDPKSYPGLAVTKDHRRHKRVEWAFAAFEPVRMIGVEGKAGASIVQHNARIPRYQSGSESAEDALNERNHITVLVHDREVDRVFAAPGPDVDSAAVRLRSMRLRNPAAYSFESS